MSTPTYYIADTLTGQIIGDLPFTGVSMDWSLSGGGTFNGKLKVSDPDVVERGALDLQEDGRHAIYVDRDGTLLWAGIIWEMSYDSSSSSIQVGASDYWSWFGRRLALNEIDEVDVQDEDIIDQMLVSALDGGHPANLTTVWEARQELVDDGAEFLYEPEERKTVAELVSSRTAMTEPNSLDFRIDTAWVSEGVASITLVLGRPRLGRSLYSTGALFDYPGVITKYSRTASGADVAGRMFAKSSSDSTGDDEIILDDPTVYADIPRTDRTEVIDVADEDFLQARAEYKYKLRSRPTRIYAIETRADVEPAIYQYRVGDYCRILITDFLHPEGFTADLRIGSISYTPQGEKVVITPWSDPDASA